MPISPLTHVTFGIPADNISSVIAGVFGFPRTTGPTLDTAAYAQVDAGYGIVGAGLTEPYSYLPDQLTLELRNYRDLTARRLGIPLGNVLVKSIALYRQVGDAAI